MSTESENQLAVAADSESENIKFNNLNVPSAVLAINSNKSEDNLISVMIQEIFIENTKNLNEKQQVELLVEQLAETYQYKQEFAINTRLAMKELLIQGFSDLTERLTSAAGEKYEKKTTAQKFSLELTVTVNKQKTDAAKKINEYSPDGYHGYPKVTLDKLTQNIQNIIEELQLNKDKYTLIPRDVLDRAVVKAKLKEINGEIQEKDFIKMMDYLYDSDLVHDSYTAKVKLYKNKELLLMLVNNDKSLNYENIREKLVNMIKQEEAKESLVTNKIETGKNTKIDLTKEKILDSEIASSPIERTLLPKYNQGVRAESEIDNTTAGREEVSTGNPKKVEEKGASGEAGAGAD